MLTAELDPTPGPARHRRSEPVPYTATPGPATPGTATEVFAHAARQVRRLVRYDAAAWMMADPVSGLPGAPSLLENFSAPVPSCTEQWRSSFVDADAVRFRPRARSAGPATTLRARAWGTGPADSDWGARFRWCARPLGFADELRLVLQVDSIPWGMVTLWRGQESDPFTAAEAETLASLSEPLGEAVRRTVRANLAVTAGGDQPPGVLTFDRDGRLLAVDDHAAAWLEQLPRQELVPTGFGLPVPTWLLVTAARSASSSRDGDEGVSRTLVQSDHGRWLVGRATSTRDAAGAPAGTVVMLEPAGPALRARIIARACGLTAREQEIAQLIARGAGTAQIAEALFLSAHTVRDHVKSVLHKVGVCSRGELVATLYTEQMQLSDAEGTDLGGRSPGPDGSLDRGMAAAAAGHWDEGARRDRARDPH